MSIVVIDYGMGNLRSVSKALEHVAGGKQVIVTADPADSAGAVVQALAAACGLLF